MPSWPLEYWKFPNSNQNAIPISTFHSASISIFLTQVAVLQHGSLARLTLPVHRLCSCTFTYLLKFTITLKSALRTLSQSSADGHRVVKTWCLNHARSQLWLPKAGLCLPVSVLILYTNGFLRPVWCHVFVSPWVILLFQMTPRPTGRKS